MNLKLYEELMEEAFDIAKSSNTPYAAILLNKDEVIAKSPNTTAQKLNKTMHAEISVMSLVSTQLFKKKHTDHFTLLSTVEPCPMCAAALAWNNIDTLVFSVSIEKLLTVDSGRQFSIPSKELLSTWNGTPIEVVSGLLEQEGLENFKSIA